MTVLYVIIQVTQRHKVERRYYYDSRAFKLLLCAVLLVKFPCTDQCCSFLSLRFQHKLVSARVWSQVNVPVRRSLRNGERKVEHEIECYVDALLNRNREWGRVRLGIVSQSDCDCLIRPRLACPDVA